MDTDASAWQTDAACLEHDPTLWFPVHGESSAEALSVCASCLVRAECLAYAVERRVEHGIWGGTTGKVRRRQARRAGVRSEPASMNASSTSQAANDVLATMK